MTVSRLKAVHQRDVLQLMESLGKGHDLRRRALRCHFCQDVITEENLGTVFPLDGEVEVTCDNLRCFELLLNLKEERKLRA